MKITFPDLHDLALFELIHDGEFGLLIERLRSGETLSWELRELIADMLEGKLKRPPHRQKKNSTTARYTKIAEEGSETPNRTSGSKPLRWHMRQVNSNAHENCTLSNALRPHSGPYASGV